MASQPETYLHAFFKLDIKGEYQLFKARRAEKIHIITSYYIPAVLAVAVEEYELIAEVSGDVRSKATSSFPDTRLCMNTAKASVIPRTFMIPAIRGQRPSNILKNMKLV